MSFSEIVILIVILVIAIVLLKFIMKVALVLLGAGLAITAGPFVLVGFIFEKICKALKIRLLMSILLVFVVWGATFAFSILGYHPIMHKFTFDSLKFFLPACLFMCMYYVHYKHKSIESLSEPLLFFEKKTSEYYLCFFSAFIFLLISAYTKYAFGILSWPTKIAWYVDLAYWIGAVLLQAYCITQDLERISVITGIYTILNNSDKIEKNSLFQDMLAKFSSVDKDEVEILLQGVAARMIRLDTIDEVKLNENCWFFNRTWHQKKISALKSILMHDIKHLEEDVLKMLSHRLNLPIEECKDYVNSYLDVGAIYNFIDGSYFVLFENSEKINICYSCGLAEITDERDESEWYCSDICNKTENLCLKIKEKPYELFRSEAIKSGFSLIEECFGNKSETIANSSLIVDSAKAWSKNQKIFAAGGQGHGFAAEQANNKIDKLYLKNAKVIGDNNLKNGADRIVQGQKIQTKFYSTASRSIGSGFDGQQGIYKYLDDTGKPMQIEVPKEQYDDAVKVMSKKIKEGKVPGVNDPNEAKNLVRKGQITYDQARNIVKFGTVESIIYDISEGVLASSFSGGISFGCVALIAYINDDEKNAAEALRIAAIQGGKTFAKSLTISVSTQQLHRVAAIQKAITAVDYKKLSSNTMCNVLSKGLGVSKTGINKAIQGTIVTSAVLMAASTGPDFIKLVRGRISKAHFFSNVAVISSGMAGGMVGSIAGGFLLSSLGPVGAFLGQAAGGVIGSVVSSALPNKLADKISQEDRSKVLRLIQCQMEYLAISFMLSEYEMMSFNSNLDKIIGRETLEVIFASGNQRATVNFFLKPIIVSVIKQRPALNYDINDVLNACSALAT